MRDLNASEGLRSRLSPFLSSSPTHQRLLRQQRRPDGGAPTAAPWQRHRHPGSGSQAAAPWQRQRRPGRDKVNVNVNTPPHRGRVHISGAVGDRLARTVDAVAMHGPSSLVIPASAVPWRRPSRLPARSSHLTAEQLDIANRSELLARGITDARIRARLRSGTLTRIAPGWYAGPAANQQVARALTTGHRLTCISATALHGLWTPYGDSSPHSPDRTNEPTGRLHVYGRRRGQHGVAPRGLDVRHRFARNWTEPDAVASVPLALEHAMRCQSGETGAILLESAMNLGFLSSLEVDAMLQAAPASVRSGIGQLSTASESGSETRVARWLRRRGFHVEQQVFVEDIGFVDLYVGGLFIEVDGRSTHESDGVFDKDRNRDLRSVSHGLQVLRLSYDQVWRRWESTQQLVLSSIEKVGAFGRARVSGLLPA